MFNKYIRPIFLYLKHKRQTKIERAGIESVKGLAHWKAKTETDLFFSWRLKFSKFML